MVGTVAAHSNLSPPLLCSLLLRAAELPPSACTAVLRHCHCRPYCLLLPVAVMRLRRVVEEGEDIPGRSPRPERWASADSWCVSNSRAMATCTHAAVAAPEGSEDEEDEEARARHGHVAHVAVAAPKGSEDEEDEEVHCASTGRPASLAAGAWSSRAGSCPGTGQKSQPGAGRLKCRGTRLAAQLRSRRRSASPAEGARAHLRQSCRPGCGGRAAPPRGQPPGLAGPASRASGFRGAPSR